MHCTGFKTRESTKDKQRSPSLLQKKRKEVAWSKREELFYSKFLKSTYEDPARQNVRPGKVS